ncbi:MAG: DUF4316 domain-containing protein, partial [Bacteroidaceae bacterium]|nr:DUF4316 domain-containing protein [Bacteroidaceae bacterium]
QNMAEERKGEPIEKWDEIGGLASAGAQEASEHSSSVTELSQGERFISLRESTGMNRKEFAEYLGIPYRTMTDWERDMKTMPSYVFALIEYKVQNEFGVTALGSQMRGIEDMVEQNDNSFDGIINNLPQPEEMKVKSDQARESVLKKLKDCVKILEDEKKERPKTVCQDRELC